MQVGVAYDCTDKDRISQLEALLREHPPSLDVLKTIKTEASE